MSFSRNKKVYFDNSTIGWFLDNDAVDLIDDLLEKYEPAISQYVIWEIGATRDSNKRIQLFTVVNKLISSKLLFADPLELVRRVCMSVYEGKDSLNLALNVVGGEWDLVNNPSLASDPRVFDECFTFKNELELHFNDVYKNVFTYMESVKKSELISDWMVFLEEGISGYIPFFTDILLDNSKLPEKFSREEVQDMILELPVLTYWFMSSMRNFFEPIKRLSNQEPISPKKVFIDMLQGTYLAYCDYFLTNDDKQLNYIEDIRIGVNRYSSFSSLEPRKEVLSVQLFYR